MKSWAGSSNASQSREPRTGSENINEAQPRSVHEDRSSVGGPVGHGSGGWGPSSDPGAGAIGPGSKSDLSHPTRPERAQLMAKPPLASDQSFLGWRSSKSNAWPSLLRMAASSVLASTLSETKWTEPSAITARNP